MASALIGERIGIARRYVRAVDLARDHGDPDALEGYVLTPSARDGLVRIIKGLASTSTQRAFRVTGPYGSGKSSFGVLLAQLISERDLAGPATLIATRRADVSALAIAPFDPVVLVGRRTSFADELLRSLISISSPEAAGRHGPTQTAAMEQLESRAAGSRDIRLVLDLLESYARHQRTTRDRGIMLLVDEMGRFIEHAASSSTAEDPSIFQQLAERCGGPGDHLAVVAFLHNRFADYVAGLGGWMEGEWARSAERYEELPFHEPAEQTLFLLADALQPVKPHARAVVHAAERLYGQATKRRLFGTAPDLLREISPRLYPLHPATAACLTASSRRFGQNERSIFSFLQSYEPAGLQRYLHEVTYAAGEWYRLDRLYDYLAAQGGIRFRSPDRERRWHLALDALALAADLDERAQAVLKVLALIVVVEPIAGLTSDPASIAWCLDFEDGEVQADLDELARRGLVHRRAGRSEYSLWSNSSVDLEAWHEQARRAVSAPQRLDESLLMRLGGRPLIAHRHYHETGHQRTFAVCVGNEYGDSEDADGAIIIVPVHPDESLEAKVEDIRLGSRAAGLLRLYNLRQVLPGDLACAHELALWRWIRDNCLELRIDDLARGEVERRLGVAHTALEELLSPLSRRANGTDGTWIQGGEIVAVTSRRDLSRLLTDTCRRAFAAAPELKNELINRPKLSTAIAAARTRLLELMLSRSAEEFLGLAGAPPERTIYLSLLHASGLHRKVEGEFGFHEPSDADPMGWWPVWSRIGALLQERGTVRFDEMVKELARPPYGLRSGPALPIIAAYILVNRRDIALMERGTFQPEITPAHFMRLGKTPANFALRHVGDVEERQHVLEALCSRLPVWDRADQPEPSLKPVVQAIFRWFNRLPEYALTTATITPLAQEVRAVLRKAKEPVELLFVELPRACDALDLSGSVKVDAFVEKLDLALSDLADVEPRLRRQVEGATLDAFSSRSVQELREQIRLDYGAHILLLRDYRLRAFVERGLNPDINEAAWVDSIASLLAGRRLASWDDQAIDRFLFEIGELSQRLTRWLALARIEAASRAPVTGVHLTSSNGAERSFFVRRRADAPGRAAALEDIRRLLVSRDDAGLILAELLAEMAAAADAEESAG